MIASAEMGAMILASLFQSIFSLLCAYSPVSVVSKPDSIIQATEQVHVPWALG